jgi:acyl-CoA hydrolase
MTEARMETEKMQTRKMSPLPTGDARPSVEVHLDEWVGPNVCDDRGELRAGKILEWMDVVGVLAATRHCRRPVVTVSVDGMELKDPIQVGERLTMTGSVAFTSERSIGIGVSVTASGRGATRRSVDGFMTFVALDEHGEATAVPQLLPETPAQQARYREGVLRREFRTQLAAGQLPDAGTQMPGATAAERSLWVREILKVLPRFPMPWDRPESQRPRSRHHSYVHKIEPVRQSELNFHGTLYGGRLMRWVETTASLSASAYLPEVGVRLASLHGLTFIRPVPAHVFVHIRSAVVHCSTDEVTVLVNVQAENPVEAQHTETLRAFLTFTPSQTQGDRVRIPPLECTGTDERALFNEAAHRLALQRTLSER